MVKDVLRQFNILVEEYTGLSIDYWIDFKENV